MSNNEHKGPYYVDDPTTEVGSHRLAEYVILFFVAAAIILLLAFGLVNFLISILNEALQALRGIK